MTYSLGGMPWLTFQRVFRQFLLQRFEPLVRAKVRPDGFQRLPVYDKDVVQRRFYAGRSVPPPARP